MNGAARATPERSAALVAGGAGFLGSHLCERLLERGSEVVCVDNFHTGDRENIAALAANRAFRLLKHDVALLEPALLPRVHAIFNFACPASPVHYQRTPLDTLFTSVHGTHRLLQLAHQCGARLFQASTSEIYGHPQVHPQKESYWGHVNPMGPRACYDEGKRCAETLCFIYREEHGTSVRVARIFNTYGPRMRIRDGRVVGNFIVQALRNEPLTVYGTGEQTRSFCYVADLVDAIILMMNADERARGPINLGNACEVPVLELAERIIGLTGSRSRIILRPLPVDDPPRRRPDISLARELLGWQPRTDLATGLALTIADFERRLVQGANLAPQVPTHAGSSIPVGSP
jgi:UDP-glucuronate decarboxylase